MDEAIKCYLGITFTGSPRGNFAKAYSGNGVNFRQIRFGDEAGTNVLLVAPAVEGGPYRQQSFFQRRTCLQLTCSRCLQG